MRVTTRRKSGMTQRVGNRGFVVLGAVLIQLCLGAIYAWSVFTPGLVDSGWSKTQTQIVFSVGLATFALVMVYAGRNLNKYGPRKLAIAGGLTLGAGYALASIGGGDELLDRPARRRVDRRRRDRTRLRCSDCRRHALVPGPQGHDHRAALWPGSASVPSAGSRLPVLGATSSTTTASGGRS